LAVAIAKFDEHLVVALEKLAFGRNEIYREVINLLSEEGRAGDMCWTKFVPGKLSGVENCDQANDQRDPFEQTLTIFARDYQRRRNKWSLFFFLLLFQVPFFPDDVNHWIDEEVQKRRGDYAADHWRSNAF